MIFKNNLSHVPKPRYGCWFNKHLRGQVRREDVAMLDKEYCKAMGKPVSGLRTVRVVKSNFPENYRELESALTSNLFHVIDEALEKQRRASKK